MFRFYEPTVDTNLFLQLEDLTTVLSRNDDLKFQYTYGSFIDIVNSKVTASTRWDVNDPKIKMAGYKTDILLRTLGNLHHSDLSVLKEFMGQSVHRRYPRFASQLLTFFENFRLEGIIKQARPGTVKLFNMRKKYHLDFFSSQLRVNATKGYELDELFCLIYLLVESDEPDPSFPSATSDVVDISEILKPMIFSLFECRSTQDVARIVSDILVRLDDSYRDAMKEYFIFPIAHIELMTKNNLFDELTRTDALKNDEMQELDPEKNDYEDETFSTWHRENKNEDQNQSFLQFDLEQGTKTDMLGGGARETEDGDQAMASVQGASGKSEQNDYSKLESLDKQESNEGTPSSESPYGEANKHASIHIKDPKTPSEQDKEDYAEMVTVIDQIRRKLAQTIENTLEHKQNQARDNLVMGRLSKNLLPLVLDENPRVFYKKDHESKEIDAVFTLLVDCSASMYDKMEETKHGITLFHEVLKQLHIPHSIVGFWEEANFGKDKDQPNYFHMIHSYDDSLYENSGPKIMQLEPEEDNRDGFSIRVITEKLQERREKNKFLLVFSDGEPAAADYEDNGIVDTHEAVLEARKRGIDVIGMFLSNDDIKESEETMMDSIYGRQHVMVPQIAELPDQFAPLLKKLLLKAI